MAEKLTPEGLIVGRIPEEVETKSEVGEIPARDEEKVRRGRKPAN